MKRNSSIAIKKFVAAPGEKVCKLLRGLRLRAPRPAITKQAQNDDKSTVRWSHRRLIVTSVSPLPQNRSAAGSLSYQLNFNEARYVKTASNRTHATGPMILQHKKDVVTT